MLLFSVLIPILYQQKDAKAELNGKVPPEAQWEYSEIQQHNAVIINL